MTGQDDKDITTFKLTTGGYEEFVGNDVTIEAFNAVNGLNYTHSANILYDDTAPGIEFQVEVNGV